MNRLKRAKQIAIVSLLVEGSGIRSIERVTGIHRDTILRLLVRVGKHCRQIMDEKMRDLVVDEIQCDEIWGFVYKKQKRVRSCDPLSWGDTYTFVAIDRHSKLVASFLVGKRNEASTHDFVEDLSRRIPPDAQITTDGWQSYRAAVPAYLPRAPFAQAVKSFTTDTAEEHRYSPPAICHVNKLPVQNYPNVDRASTSHVERQNLTMRMHLRRLTRLTLSFSKKLANLKAAIALHFAWYNFVRIHRSLRMTPAMAAAVTHRIWDIEELIP